MENLIIHKAESRGHATHGWLDSHHTFSFANYYNPERVHFGVLRVLNDDVVEGGKGFDTHPHENMEIISIPLSGDLEHKDSMGTTTVIRQGDVQIMSAGTGVFHSEYNKNAGSPVNFLQIWIFPKQRNIAPRYAQQHFDPALRVDQWETIVAPLGMEGNAIGINQDAWLSMTRLSTGKRISYVPNQAENGVYVFVISGSGKINGTEVNKRDGIGVWETDQIHIESVTPMEVLLIEVPMNLRRI